MVNIDRVIRSEKKLKDLDFMIAFLAAIAFSIIVGLHAYVSFFPVLFVFDICFWIGHPLFVRFALKKRWFECIKDYYLSLKYITIPWLVMELLVMLCYPHETMMIIKSF